VHLSPHFPIQPSWGNIDNEKKDVKDNQKLFMVGQDAAKAAEMIQNVENQPDFGLVKEKVMKYIWRLSRRPPEFPDRRHEGVEVSPPQRSA